MKAKALRKGITVDRATIQIGIEWASGARVMGVDEQGRPFALLLTPDDLKIIAPIAQKEADYMERINEEPVLADADDGEAR